ncbi:ECF RNA polymerase sigma-E factor [Thalassocella blandensis]|nr:ECF RNA polymerase sigma-E factor [Thalassocella blandensis]
MVHNKDLSLVESLLKGDEDKFNAFYNLYFPRCYRFCKMRIENEETCKDIVQQSLINAMKGLHTYRGEASLYTWLCQIARNEIHTWYNKTGQKEQMNTSIENSETLLATIESIPSGINGEKYSIQDETLNELVQFSLDSLPSAYGKVLELKYMEGLSVAEIAYQMSTGEIAVQSLLARARKAFKNVFEDIQKETLSLA